MTQARRHPRAPLRALVHCELPGGGRLIASGGNISCGGLFVPTAAEVRVGESLRLKFRLPYPGHTVEQEARVIWRRPAGLSPIPPAGVGLEFRDLPPQERKVIADYVDRTGEAPA